MTENEKRIITEAFTLGFMMSREGFNGECSFQCCSEGLKPYAESEERFRERLAENKAFQEGLEETLERMSRHNANVDRPDTAAQDSASKSNNPAVSG